MKKKRVKGTLLRTITLSAVAMVLGLTVYNWNARSLLGNQMPMPFGYGMAVVLSGSMEPALQVNDLVIIRETEQVEPGDILVYQSGSSLVIHRLVALDGDQLILQGDANNTPDRPVDPENVKGKLVLVLPQAGDLVHQLRKPPVAIALLGLAIWLMERSYRKEQQEDSAELEDIQAQIQLLMEELKENNEE